MSAWGAYWREIGSEDWLYARELIELSPSVRAHFAGHVRAGGLDWSEAAAAADTWGASSTERRLLDLVLSLVNPDVCYVNEWREDDEGPYRLHTVTGVRRVDVRELGSMGSWRDDVAGILFRYVMGAPPRRLDELDD